LEQTLSQVNDAYTLIREKIVHEDDLVHQRITWVITFNGLLFTAYGFSLGADAASIIALANGATTEQIAAYNSLASTILTLRVGMVAVGIASSLAALLGVAAAYRAIRDDEAQFSAYRTATDTVTWLPLSIGRVSTNVAGMLCGLLVPFFVACVWTWIGKLVPDTIFVITGLAIAAVAVLFVWPLLGGWKPLAKP
jgi:hypothetical protein